MARTHLVEGRMITKEQAMTANEFHFDDCKIVTGPRGGNRVKIEVWRRSGKTKTWKTRPNDWRIPVKHGLYLSHEITHETAGAYHVASDCPLQMCEQCEHEWQEVDAEPPYDVCSKCGERRD